MTTGNIAVAAREIPFLKYRVDEVVRPDHDGNLTVEETLKALGLDFTVDKRKVYTHSPKGHRVTVPGMFANVRTDTETVLGVVGDRYEVVQNVDALRIGNVLMDTGEALIESGWALRGGRQVGVTFRIPGADISVPGDADGGLQMFLMVQTSHDGNSSLTGHVGPVRPACTNMIRLYMKAAVASFRIRHTSGITGAIAGMREALGMTFRYSEAQAKLVERLLTVELVESQVAEILQSAFPIKADSTDAQRAKSTQAALLTNWQTSPTIAAIRPTGWGLVNAVNEYFEHLQPVRTNTFDRDSVRGISMLQGTAYQATNRIAAEVLRAG